MDRSIHRYWLLLPLVCLVTEIGTAESTTPPGRLETITVTASRVPRPVSELSLNTAWIDNSQISLIAHTHVSEALLRIPGTWITRANGQEHLTAIRSPVFTGAGSCGAFLMMEDSIPLRAAGFCNVNQLMESTSEQAGRIEVIRGPGVPLYGSNAMHGAINIISPEFPQAIEHNLSMEGGVNDFARLGYSRGSDRWHITINLTHDNGYKDASGYDQQKFRIQHRRTTNDFEFTTRMTLSNLNQETAGYVNGYMAYDQAGLRRSNENPEAFRDAKSFRLHSKITNDSDSDQIVSFTPYVRYTEMSFLQHFLPGQPLEENGQVSFGIQSEWSFPISDNLTIISGLDLEYTQAWLEEFQSYPTDSSSPFLRGTLPIGAHYDYEVDARNAAPFLQLTWQVNDRLQLTPGVRFDYVNYDYDNRMISGRTREDGTACGFGGCRYSRPEDRSDTFIHWSPRIGGVLDLNNAHQIYMSLVQGFRAPQATELYRLQNNQTVSRIDQETLDSFELGFRGVAGGFSYDVSLFKMKKDNVIFRDSDRNNVDNGQTGHEGVEWSLTADLLESLNLQFNATLAKHQYNAHQLISDADIKGNDIDTAPRHMGSIVLGWQLNSRTHGELEWVHMGSYYEDPLNLHEYEGHDLYHLRISWAISNQWNMQIRLINLLNTNYADRADFAFGSDRYFVGLPLTIYAGLEGTF